MGVPPEMEVRFHTASAAIPELPKYRDDPRPGLLLTGDIATMRVLVEGAGVDTINIGGIHSKPGRVQRMRYVFLTPDEEQQLRDLASRGVTITAQDVPGARPISLDDLLAGEAL
jgi:mannose/fructose/N-acetylgalactosamine-specific phosphotransferase system component IIB